VRVAQAPVFRKQVFYERVPGLSNPLQLLGNLQCNP
jgi:hypothetical protein